MKVKYIEYIVRCKIIEKVQFVKRNILFASIFDIFLFELPLNVQICF